MAKRGKPAAVPAPEKTAPAASSDVLGDFAEDLGRFLGTVQNRATTWLQQRKDITEQLTQIRDTANQYLQQLGAEGARMAERLEKARHRRSSSPKPAGSEEASALAPATRRRTMSAAQRAEVRRRMKRYWARRRSATAEDETTGATKETAAAGRKSKASPATGTGGRRKMSPAARKRISDAQKARWAKLRRNSGSKK